MSVFPQVVAANASFAASFGDRSRLAPAPRRKFAVLTCMDARLDPARIVGLDEGDAHVIRNAGGRATGDAVRSLVISAKMLGTREWFVIHHTNCGMQTFTNDTLADLLAQSLEPAGVAPCATKGGSQAGRLVDFLPFTDLERSVTEDVAAIRAHPLVSAIIPIYGLVYDVHTGLLREVPEAMAVGAAVE